MSKDNAVMTRQDVRGLLHAMKGEIAAALPSHMDPDHFIRVALTAINKTPLLLQCTKDSLLSCLMDLSQLGLEADSVSGLAYLIPYKDKIKGYICQLIVGYKGFVELAYRHPKVKGIRWSAVHKNDKWEYEEGLNPQLRHVPTEEDDEGELTHAYAIAELEGGAKTWVVLNRRQIMKARSSSRGADSEYSPWKTWPEAMWEKTAVRAIAKRIPKSPELQKALNRDDEMNGVIDVDATVQAEEPKLVEKKMGGDDKDKPESPAKAETDDPLA